MAAKTGIEWTDSTWNPLRGCSKVSAGCKNCYAENVAVRFSGPGQPYEGLASRIDEGLGLARSGWTGKVAFIEKHLLDPLKWGPVISEEGVPETSLLPALPRTRRIFVNSMSDLFHESVPNEWIDRIFAVMALCPQHHFQVLTKRPERMLAYFKMVLEEKDMQRWINQVPSLIDGLSGKKGAAEKLGAEIEAWEFPLLNVWLGVSVENQAAADERIPLLLQTPAAMRFLSCEPLLGAVDLSCVPWPADHLHGIDGLNSDGFDALRLDDRNSLAQLAHLDWVIAGGESGPGARPMHPDWARGLRDQCKAASVPFFFKQWGEWLPYGQAPKTMLTTVKPDQSLGWPMYRIGKKVAGSYLNGELHKEFPEVPDANS